MLTSCTGPQLDDARRQGPLNEIKRPRFPAARSNAYTMWSALAPELVEEGYCVYALNYGDENQSLVGLVPGLLRRPGPRRDRGVEGRHGRALAGRGLPRAGRVLDRGGGLPRDLARGR